MTSDGELLCRYTESNSEDAFAELVRAELKMKRAFDSVVYYGCECATRFTLIELLVVIASISILAALLLDSIAWG